MLGRVLWNHLPVVWLSSLLIRPINFISLLFLSTVFRGICLPAIFFSVAATNLPISGTLSWAWKTNSLLPFRGFFPPIRFCSSICTSADLGGSCCIETTSRPDIPCIPISPLHSLTPIRSSAESPRGIFHLVCSSTCHHCSTLCSLPSCSKGAALPSLLLRSFLSQRSALSIHPSSSHFVLNCCSNHHCGKIQCLPCCGTGMFRCLCT